MKLLGVTALMLAAFSQACTEPLEVQCVDNIVGAIKPCEEAAKEKGSDHNVDIDCIRHASGLRAVCWPCVCKVAKDNNVTVIGCPNTQ
jgi:hypothetical protein